MPTKRRGRRALAYVCFLTVAWIILWGVSLHRLSASELFWTTVLYLFCSLPTVLFVAGHPFRIPLMPMWGLGYFFMFGMPMLSEELRSALDFFVPEATMVSALRLAALGAGMCLLAFYTPLGRWVERTVPKIKAPWDPLRAPLLGSLLTLLGLGIHYSILSSPPPPAIAQIATITSQLATVGIVILFLLQLRGRLHFVLKLLLWGLAVPLELLFSLGTGLLYEVIRSLSPLMFCYAAERQRIPWQMLAAGALLLLPFAGVVKQEFRSAVWYGESEGISTPTSPIQRGLAFVGMAKRQLSEGGPETYLASAEMAQARSNYFSVFLVTTEMTPAVVPFWRGGSYLTILWVFVPRFVYPGKPSKLLGQEFGHRYGLLDPDDETTSFNLPHQLVEMYINFGPFGVLLGMAVIGLLYRSMATLLGHPEAGERGLIIGCALFSNMLMLEADFSLLLGGIVYYLLILYFFVRYLGKRPQEVPAAAIG